MSLSGSVEDLPLLEILQVVSFCQKTGHLMVKADAGEAAVVFDSGRVVAGYAWDVEPLPPQHPAPGPERERVVRDRIAGILEKLVRLRDGTFAFTLNQQVETKLAGRDLSGEMLPGGGVCPAQSLPVVGEALPITAVHARQSAALFNAGGVARASSEVTAWPRSRSRRTGRREYAHGV